jgi:tRNA threonylcarbamoyladenosine biosynthesis protein TsaB
MSGALVLGLTTASARGGAALVRSNALVAEASYEDEMQHAERLFGAVDQALEAAGASRADLGGIACDIGPGSFTGVRVGLASAKGMALSLGVPLVGVCSLEAMAAAAWARAEEGCELVCAVLDAKRGESFVAVYASDLSAVRAPAHVSAADTLGWLGDLAREPALRFCGRRATELGVADRLLTGGEGELPHAEWVARRGAPLLGSAPDIATLEPLYLRAPDATPPRR